MFRIINITTGRELGLVEKVNYIKISPTTGCFIPAKKEDAVGLAYKGRAYNLDKHTDITNADTVFISETDGGMTLYDVQTKEASLERQLAETDEAAIELYEANIALEIANAEQDEAIIEIYEMIGDNTNG